MSMKPKLPSNSSHYSASIVVDVDLNDGETLDDYEDEILCFHDSKEIPSTIGMTETTEQKARELGAVPCSGCFRDVDGVQYDFDYMGCGMA